MNIPQFIAGIEPIALFKQIANQESIALVRDDGIWKQTDPMPKPGTVLVREGQASLLDSKGIVRPFRYGIYQERNRQRTDRVCWISVEAPGSQTGYYIDIAATRPLPLHKVPNNDYAPQVLYQDSPVQETLGV